MIRKLSDLDYKDLKDFQPSFEFRIDTTLSSATKCTPLEIPARTIGKNRGASNVLAEGQRTRGYWRLFHQYLTVVL
jgi:hypothetical protein